MAYRIGFGIDFHQLAEGRPFWLGGVKIPYERGAVGHSDADVLLHAICDALLGALALGDIGVHFPNTDPAYKDIDSKILLAESYRLVRERGYRVVNIDSTVCLEAPKVMPFAPAMREAMAACRVCDGPVGAIINDWLGHRPSGRRPIIRWMNRRAKF